MKRVAWTFLFGVLCAFGVQATLQNEWTFESDPYGLPLTSATNDAGTAQFAATSTNFQSIVFTASASDVGSSAGNRVLLCVGAATNKAGMAWTNGAILNAGLTSATSGVHYLRYDVAYSLSTSNNSGTALGAYFTGANGTANDRAAGFVLGYDKDSSILSDTNHTPKNTKITRITGLNTDGSLLAIAEVNLSSKTLKVWYSVNGSTPDYSTPAASKTNLSLTAISNLCFHATGTFRSPGSTNYAAVDNIRMADTWEDITDKVPDYSKGPAVEIARVIITTPTAPTGTVANSSRPIGTALGATNTVQVVFRSRGAPASNVTSSVASAATPGYFSITSNNLPAAVLSYPQYWTNTFYLIIQTDAPDDSSYVFNVGAAADGASGASTNFTLTVGALIAYKDNSITVVSTNGLYPSKYEPGEILNITVTSENIGTRPVSNITNSLSADPAYFAIINTNSSSQNYSILSVGAVTSTTYRVTILAAATNGTHWFSVTNKAASFVWPASFSIDVFNQGDPSVSPASITISNLLAGSIAKNTEVEMTNAGIAGCTFNITDDGAWGVFYDETPGTLGATAFATYNNVIELQDPGLYKSTANDGVSAAISLGFDFPFYGTTYSNFYVTADGYIGLINDPANVPAWSTDRANRPLPVTNATTQIIAPFWGALSAPTGSLHYARTAEGLAISYSGVKNGTSDLEFQAALFTDGRMEFRYKTIAGFTNVFGQTNVTIGVQDSVASYKNLAVTPINGTSVTLTPKKDQWVRYATQEIGIDRQGSARITFTADASGITAATSTTFNAWFNWSTGGSNAVFVSVSVSNTVPIYSAVSSLSFTGAAGRVTSALFVITNAGTGPLTYTISDDSVTGISGYTTNTPVVYSWIDISSTGTDVSFLADQYTSAAEDGYSAMIPLKFVLPFYGSSYTQFCVSVNGALRLDTTGRVFAAPITATTQPAQMIAAYLGDLLVDANTTIKYLSTADQLVISWENVKQWGGGLDQTFQAVLKPSGDITFQYKKLEGASVWPNTDIGLRDTADRIKLADIRKPEDKIVSTNFTTVSTQYVSVVSNRAVRFELTAVHVIGFTPDRGSIAAGSNAVITFTGDASGQSAGTNSIVASTTLTITHNLATGSPNTTNATLAVRFTATNSAETVFVRAAEEPVADTNSLTITVPVLAPTIGRTSDGNVLSWIAPSTNEYIYNIDFKTNLMTLVWEYLGRVTNVTTFFDTKNTNVPTIYYKVTSEEGF